MDSKPLLHMASSLSVVLISVVLGTNRYYNSYLSYGSRLQQVWCKFSFPNKPPASGLYPYYSSCHVRNYTNQYFCFDPLRPNVTMNTMITAMWSNILFWWIFIPGTNDAQLYKCCEPPAGYYIDYLSCYFQPTHDPFFEYYDNGNMFIVYCAQGFVMTGISKKINPYTREYHLDWIQCCRLGFGPHKPQIPPVIYDQNSGAAAYYAQRSDSPYSAAPSDSHLAQYRTARSAYGDDESDDYFLNQLVNLNESKLLTPERDRISMMKRRLIAKRTGKFARAGPVDYSEKNLKLDRAKPTATKSSSV